MTYGSEKNNRNDWFTCIRLNNFNNDVSDIYALGNFKHSLILRERQSNTVTMNSEILLSKGDKSGVFQSGTWKLPSYNRVKSSRFVSYISAISTRSY